MISIAFSLVPRTTSGEENPYAKSMVVPAPSPRHPVLAAVMNREARLSLDELGYTSLSERQTMSVIRRAKAGNVARCLDKTLIALGKATGSDLLVCPRVVGVARGQSVKMTFARVSKKRVWHCRRQLKTSRKTSIKKATAEAVAFCMDQLLSPKPKGLKQEKPKEKDSKRKRKRKRKDSPRRHAIGAAGIMVPAGRERFTGYTDDVRFSKHLDFDFSYGVGLFYEWRKISWLAMGFQFDYYSLGKRKKKGAGESDEEEADDLGDDMMVTELQDIDRLNLFNIGGGIKFLYPGAIVEPYLKIAFGLTIAGAREKETYPEVVVGSGFGANYQARVGVMAVFSYVGVFADIGVFDALWFPNVEATFDVFDTAMVMDVVFVMNLGVAVVF